MNKDISIFTDIIKLIDNTIVIQGKKSWDIYLVNKHTWNYIAFYQNNNWIASTWEVKLTFDPSDNITDMDNKSNFEIIAY